MIEYDPPANGVAQYNGIADSLSLQPTATRSSSAPPLPYKEGPNSSLKVPEIMQNTIADAPPSIRPYMSPSIIGARSNSLHSSLGSFPTASYMVHARYGPTPSAARYPVAQSSIAYSTMDPSTVQQVTYPTLQSVSSNVQSIGEDSDPYSLHTAHPSNLLLGGSCGHQTLHSSSTAQPGSSHFLIMRSGLTSLSQRPLNYLIQRQRHTCIQRSILQARLKPLFVTPSKALPLPRSILPRTHLPRLLLVKPPRIQVAQMPHTVSHISSPTPAYIAFLLDLRVTVPN